MADPIHQFEIKKIVPLELNNIDISFTNSSMFMILAILVVFIFLILSIKNKKIIPSRFQTISELLYEFIANMINDNIGYKGQKFFPFIYLFDR